ncbi:cupin domain-containing protein [Robbsia sp. KACC 23696]|uniref:cupin domain-containing protein n=1 Tax=Robbsia sp. KACC 23696 TaxID=3149231 RepID=UPI00325A498F
MIEHHPADETLARLSAGDLETGPSLVVAAHIAQCEHCRKVMRVLEGVGGAAIEQAAPVSFNADVAALLADPDAALLQREPVGAGAAGHAVRFAERADRLTERGLVLRRPGVGASWRAGIAGAWRGSAVSRRKSAWDGLTLPSPLSAYEASPWRMVGPGIHWARVLIPEDPAAKVLLLKAVPGTGLPPHTHSGVEYTCILQGSFQDGERHMQIGDLSECDENEHHRPMVNSTEACVCVLSIDGTLVMEGWLARLAQRIVGL